MEGNAAESALLEAEEREFTPVIAADDIHASDEQMRYSQVLGVFMKIGLAAITVTFALYLIGFPKPHIPLGDVSQYWGLKVGKYLEATGNESGWSWTGNLGKGDFLNFAPITLMASITVICYASILPMLTRKRDYIYAGLAIGEILVLVLAASGVLPAEAM